jgi:dethiobiotin synthetase
MNTLFVTASGTDVGKTFVTLKLIADLRDAGYRVRALKPVASGFDAGAAGDSDTAKLLHAQGLALDAANLDAVSPWRFAAPLSPDMAAAREGRAIAFDALVEFCRAPRDADIVVIEGIGGVMVPLDAEHTVLDWIVAIGAPALLVVGSYLGTLSHSLTAALALRSRGVGTLGVVVSESAEQPVPSTETAAAIARFVQPTPVRIVPRNARNGDAPLLPLLGLDHTRRT